MGRTLGAILFVGCALGTGCDGGRGPQVGSQTNWFVECTTTSECDDGLSCECGHCTLSCASDPTCGELPGATCMAEAAPSTVAVCGGQAAPAALCLPMCGEDGGCPGASSCMAGVCMPTGSVDHEVSVDIETRFQTLIGFGAGVGFTEDLVVAHPANAELREALFVEAGLDVLRLRNRYEDGNDDALLVTAELLDGVEATLGRRPTVLINSSSPPGALKANGNRQCAGNADTCTLRRDAGGAFDYAALAEYWRSSLDAYASAGVAPDYLSLQNNPNLVPAADAPGEGCFFLPEEGTATVTVDDVDVTVPLAGYREALVALKGALEDMPQAPRIVAPETTGIVSAYDYAGVLDATEYDAISMHLYGVAPAAPDKAALDAIGGLSRETSQPLLQSEMAADGMDSAVLIHHALVDANASAYLQNSLVTEAEEAAPVSLALLTADSFERQLPYYAFAHYGRHTDPGWTRVAVTGGEAPLASAWVAPDDRALAMIFVNPTDRDTRARLQPPPALASDTLSTMVLRTVFDGIERMASLGPLPSDGSLRLPARSMVTVVLSAE